MNLYLARLHRQLCLILPGLFAVCLLLTAPAYASGNVPENAVASPSGMGWNCIAGFRQSGEGCQKVVIPDNAFATNLTYGKGWDCAYGFTEEIGDICASVSVPENGFLDPSGNRWHCLRGFAKNGDVCQQIDVPQNGYLTDDSFGNGWSCDRGFRAEGKACRKIAVPAHGYLSNKQYGAGWLCDRGYRASREDCVAVRMPAHAYFVEASFGDGWKCDYGYEQNGAECIVIQMPANAHIDGSGNRWNCNPPFRKRSGRCIQE